MSKRKFVAFDIDTKVAKKIYGQGYRKIYYYIESQMEQYGFRHIQGSGYESIDVLENIDVIYLINKMIHGYPGMEKCVRDIRLTDRIEDTKLNYLFQYDGTTGKYPDKSKSKPKQRDDYTR